MKKVQSHTSKNIISEAETVQSLLEIIAQQNEIIAQLKKENEELRAIIEELKATIEELKARLNENSQNSNFPPSRDLYPPVNKNRSLRKNTGKHVGGQPNHKGTTRELSENPDEIHILHVDRCTCGCDLHNQKPIRGVERRQIFEIPKVKYQVIEYQSETKRCPVCGKIIKSTFPDEVPFRINYGPNLKGTALYMKDVFNGSYEKTSKFFDDIFGLKICKATICGFIDDASNTVIPFENEIIDALRISHVVHFDETGCRILGRNGWVHVACTPEMSVFYPHEKRGAIAMKEMGILPNYHGYAVHDCWASYNQFPCKHAYCNAHLIREQRGVVQSYPGNQWATDMEMLLMNGHEYLNNNKTPSLTFSISIFKDYDTIVNTGFACNPPPEPSEGKRRRKNSKPRNLLLRLQKNKEGILSFLLNPEVPFTNNQAERDLRPIKTQQKVCGTFRSERGARSYFRIHGFIVTLRKNGCDLLEALRLLAMGIVPKLSDIIGGRE